MKNPIPSATERAGRGQKLDEVLAYYKAFASELLTDIDLMEQDSEFLGRGGQILYAIDFSEIYAYCMRAPDSFFSMAPRGAWDDGLGRTSLVEVHESILQFILFQATNHLILLDPYGFELETYYNNLHQQVMRAEATRVARVLDRIEQEKARAAYRDFTKIAVEAQQSDGAVTEVKLSHAGELLDQALPIFQKATERVRPWDAMGRLISLRGGRRLQFLGESAGFDAKPDEEIVDHWLDLLEQQRPDRTAQNAVDAEAVGALISANRQLLKQQPPRLIRLVTRSPKMNAIMREDASLGVWQDAGGNALRAPKGFLTVFNENAQLELNSDPQRRLENLRRWKRSFERLAGNPTTGSDLTSDLTESEIIRRQVVLNTNGWRRYCSFQAVQFSLTQEQPSLEESLGEAPDIAGLHSLVGHLILNLRADLDRAHFAMKSLLSDEVLSRRYWARQITRERTSHILNERGEALTAPHLTFDDDARVLLYTPHGTPLPFSLFLMNRRLRAAMRDLATKPTQVLNLVLETKSGQEPTLIAEEVLTNSEWYLALAYAHSAIGAWEMTDSAIAGARQELESIGDASLRDYIQKETAYFTAKIVRHLEKPIQEASEALQKITEIAERLPTGGNEHTRAYMTRMRSEALKLQFTLIKKKVEEKSESEEEERHTLRQEGFNAMRQARETLKGLKQPGVDRCDLLKTLSIMRHNWGRW